MAGVADKAYRILCRKMGAGILYSEMVSAKGVCYQNTKTAELCSISEYEHPMGIQLFGSEPEFMAEAAKKLLEFKPDFYDINMGCPVPKVVKTGAGSALMKNPKLAGEIVAAVKKAVDIPVTVKFRSGWDEHSINAPEFAKEMEANGADAVTIHARTRSQFYSGKADWNIIKKAKESVKIPVCGNGDIKSAEDAEKIYETTGVDSIMIARASYGNPWIFRQINDYAKGLTPKFPSISEKMNVMLWHIRKIIEFSSKSEELAIAEARKYASWYAAGLKNAAEYRRLCFSLKSYKEAEELAQKILCENM